MQIVWTDPALELVEDVAIYIAQDDPDAAQRWVLDLFEAVEQLAEFPESGRMVPEIAEGSRRELIFGAYRVFYRVGSAVEILAVRHGSQLIRPEELSED